MPSQLYPHKAYVLLAALYHQQANRRLVFTLLARVIFMLAGILVTVIFATPLLPQEAVAEGLLAPEEMAVIIRLIMVAAAAHQAVT
jgi:hypothetical protein